MKIGRVGSGPSRRELRRQREAEAIRHDADYAADHREVKPALIKKGARPRRDITLPIGDLLDRRQKSEHKLPNQQALFRRNVLVRHLADISVGIDGWEEAPDIRRTVVEDIDRQGRLFLAQTSPPLLRSQVGHAVRLSFLDRYYDVPGGRWLRVGYETQVLELMSNHRLSATLRADVIVVDGPRRLEQVTARSAFRLVPPEDLDLRLVLRPGGERVGLMDISFSGARFYHDHRWNFSVGRPLTCSLRTGGLDLPLTARVVRQDEIRDRWGEPHGVTCVRFVHNDPVVRHDLMRLLTEVYRLLLARRSGIKEEDR